MFLLHRQKSICRAKIKKKIFASWVNFCHPTPPIETKCLLPKGTVNMGQTKGRHQKFSITQKS